MLARPFFFMTGLLENVLDFEIIPTGNPNTLIFIDSSTYIGQPDSPRIEVLFPGFDRFFIANIIPNQVNTFNANTLGFSPSVLATDAVVELPDGVYTIKYMICPYTTNFVVKSFCRTVLLEQNLKQLYEKVEATDCTRKHDKEILNAIAEIHMLIEGCRYIADQDARKATEFYAVAERLIRHLHKKLEKCCK